MANKIVVDDIAPLALPLLHGESVLGAIAFRDAEPHFSGGVGSKVGVRIIDVIKATEFTGTDADLKSLAEERVDIELTKTPRNLLKLTAREVTLDIRSFASQVLAPATAGIAEAIEETIAATLDAESGKAGAFEITAAEPLKALSKAAAELTRRKIGRNGRYLVIGPDMEEAFLNLEQLQKVNEAGDSSALRNGVLGRLMSFTVVVSPFVKQAHIVTPGGVAAAVRAPESADTATTRTVTDNGYSMQLAIANDPIKMTDVLSVASFVGSGVVHAKRLIPFKIVKQYTA